MGNYNLERVKKVLTGQGRWTQCKQVTSRAEYRLLLREK
jgi:tRNA U34 5-carboxymethylaminomethyl modifying enzyme MnmG/GidA